MTSDKPAEPIARDRREILRILGAGAVTSAVLAPSFARAAAVGSRLSGVIRVCGTKQMAPLIQAWSRAFQRRWPGVRFDIDLKGTSTGQFGLQMDTADIALSGRRIYPYEYYGIYRRSQLLTVEVPVAVGSWREVGKSSALAVFVNAANPIRQLSLKQLDGIFGAERTGGWQAMEWRTDVARGPEGNLRTWGQLGLRGGWAGREITPYGPPALHPGGVSYFQSRVMGGADTWNERLREYPDRAAMIRALVQDRQGIAYASFGYAAPGVRAVALSEQPGGAAIPLDEATVRNGTYPLSRFAYMYLAPDTVSGDARRLPPHIEAFLRFVLSPAGQRLVEHSGYYPLSSRVASRASADLNRPAGETSSSQVAD